MAQSSQTKSVSEMADTTSTEDIERFAMHASDKEILRHLRQREGMTLPAIFILAAGRTAWLDNHHSSECDRLGLRKGWQHYLAYAFQGARVPREVRALIV